MPILNLLKLRQNLGIIQAEDDNNEWLNILNALNATSSDKQIIIRLSDGTQPPLRLNQIAGGPIFEGQLNGADVFEFQNSGKFKSFVVTGTPPIDVDSTTLCPNLNAKFLEGQPITNIAKLDTHKTAWAASWFYAIPPASPEGPGADSVGRVIVPEGGTFVIRKIGIEFAGGSHTAGGQLTFNICKRAAPAGGDTNISAFPLLDNTNNTVNTLYTTDISDHTLTALDKLYVRMSGRAGTITETNITCYIWGTQTFNSL